MNAKLVSLKGLLLFALLALALTACGVQAAAKSSAEQPESVLAAEPEEKPVEMAAPAQPAAMIETLTRIYRSPNTDEVVDVRTPSQAPIQLVGRSADGDWLAAGDAAYPGKVTGWIPAGEVAVTVDIETLPVLKIRLQEPEPKAPETAILTQVYFSPNLDSQVLDVLTPFTSIAPYARTSDGGWLAVSESNGSPAGWIQAGDVKLPAGTPDLPVIYGP